MRTAAGAPAPEDEANLRPLRGLRRGIERKDQQQEAGRQAAAGSQAFSEKGVNRVSRS